MIIVTLSVVCTLKGMSRWSIQRTKTKLLCIVYAMLFVGSVDKLLGWFLKKVMGRNALEILMPSYEHKCVCYLYQLF